MADESGNEYRVYGQGFTDGATSAWHTVAALIRAGVGVERLGKVAEEMQTREGFRDEDQRR